MPDTLRVLYVDDEPGLLEIGKLFLEGSGDFSVTTIDSATAALDLLQREPFDAIVSDYQMPGMDGIEFLKKLKASGNATPFIIFTGKGREEVVIDALNNGADFYLQKGGEPISQYRELEHKIRTAISRQRTEKLVKDTERRLNDIINFLPDATFAIDTEGNVIAWNLAIEEMTGVPARDMVGKGNYEYAIPFYGEHRPVLIDLVSVPDEEMSRGRYAIIKKEGDILIAETTLPRPLGRYSVLLGKASLLYNEEGEVIGAIESIRDITEQKQSEEELRKAHDEYVDLLERMNDVYYRSDTEGRLILASESWAKNLGYDDLDECLGRNIAGTFYANPGDRARFLEEVYRNGSVSDYEITLKKKDGTSLPVATASYLYFDETGNILGVEGTWRDITRRKRAEEELAESEARYHEFFRVSRDSVFITSPEGSWIEFNDAILDMFGYENREEMFDVPVSSIYANPEERSAFIHLIEQDGYVKEYPIRLKQKDGTVIDTLITAVPVRNPDGSLKAFTGTIRDVTTWKRAEEDARRAHEELEASYEELTATDEELRQMVDNLGSSEQALRESKMVLSEIVMGSPIPQFVIDRNHRILHWNRALEEYSGIPANTVAGTNQQWRAFYAGERPCLADLLVDGEIEKIRQVYSGRCAKSRLIEGAYEVTDFFPKFKGGTWLYFTAAPIRDLNGTVIGAVETLEDITERKEAERELLKTNEELNASYEQLSATEEELRQNLDEIISGQRLLKESEEKYRTVFENTGTAMVVIEESGTIGLANEEFVQLSGFSKEEIEGKKKWPEFVVKEDRERMLAQNRQRMLDEKKALTHYEFRFVTKSGDIRAIYLTIGVIPGTKMSIASLLDITERKRADENLNHTNEELTAAFE